ncbi:ATP-binding protein [Vibrio kyushuensis]|uniref:ATP-binding protein n=1 Tax=Vibrio kyushuensis TaxID=2910249 RepID=UPI003D143931
MFTQATSYLVWKSQENQDHIQLIDKVSKNIAYQMVSTARFFVSLPKGYRHIVLDQLRDMGGTRFYVSLNREFIEQNITEENADKRVAEVNFSSVLNRELPNYDTQIQFSRPSDLKVHTQDTLLSDLPKRWSGRLLMEPLSPPVVIAQIHLNQHEWLYIATNLPVANFMQERPFLSTHEITYLSMMLLGVIVIGYFVVRQQTLPLKYLKQAALGLSQDMHHSPIPIKGSLEFKATATAFNSMQEKIQEHIDEREQLVRALSHDLKTPITRLKLRSEMLSEEHHKHRLFKDIEAIEQMVLHSIEALKKGNNHEPVQCVDLQLLLKDICSDLQQPEDFIQLNAVSVAIDTRPLTLKRALSNIVENALFYGKRCEISIKDTVDAVIISVRDFGQGIPDHQIERVFTAFVRLETSRNNNTGGTGLGLGIARNAIRSLGGELRLRNHEEQGLVATIYLDKKAIQNRLQPIVKES